MSNGIARRAAILGAALLGLIAIVTLASRSRAPAGGGGTRPVPTDTLLQYALLITLVGVIAIVSTGLYLLGVAHRQEHRAAFHPPKPWRTLLALLAFGATVAALIAVLHRFGHSTQQVKLPPPPAAQGPREAPQAEPVSFDWVPVAVVGGLTVVGLVVAGALLLRGRVPKGHLRPPAAIAVADALDESLADLLDEPDARRAVIAAYARMETALARSGLARADAEAPREYLARALLGLGAGGDSVALLTRLFERAKFSPSEVDAGMKEAAISTLVTLRDELRGQS